MGVAIETLLGPVVESLMERGFAVHSINPRQLDRLRDQHSPVGAKDRRDARGSGVGSAHGPALPVSADGGGLVEFREWLRIAEDLGRDRTRLANQMLEQLWRYYPQFIDAVDGDAASAFALTLWKRLPNPGARRARQRRRSC